VETLDFGLELKSVGEAGTFSGLASVYGNTDAYNDVIIAGAFSKHLQARGHSLPVLWNHDSGQPAGRGILTDSAEGLHIKGELNLDTTIGKESYSNLRKSIINGLSIGFTVPDGGAERKDGKRYLREIRLFEVSLVAFPANERARITQVKSGVASVRDFERFLHEAGWSNREAKLLAEKGWAGLSRQIDEPAVDDSAELLAWLKSETKDFKEQRAVRTAQYRNYRPW
jgi:HK97 family phage prohead protease